MHQPHLVDLKPNPLSVILVRTLFLLLHLLGLSLSLDWIRFDLRPVISNFVRLFSRNDYMVIMY